MRSGPATRSSASAWAELGSHVVADAELIAPKPARLTFEEAAAFPWRTSPPGARWSTSRA